MVDSLNHDGLQDPFSGDLMGAATDAGNAARGIIREEQDQVAARSHQRADAARTAGIFNAEIAPLEIPQRRGPP
ncbi:probable acetyl-CoA acetyltransferase [Arthrobacter sp. Hiyo4]|nr:probable acetyl-CoA acetyltransferase [Arthrobacter sp. Hiyo4]